MKQNIVYKTTNIINGKIYVGKHSTENLDDGYLGSGVVLNKAIKKYGKENFIREIIEICETEHQSFLQEKYWVDCLSATNRNIGYNISTGGLGGNTFYNSLIKEETRIKISEKSKIYANLPEIKERVSKEAKDRWNDPIWKDKQIKIQIEAAKKPERIKKISDASKNNWKNPEYVNFQKKLHIKYHYILKDPEGIIWETFSLKQFCKDHNLTCPSMVIVCSGKIKHHKGWTCVSRNLKDINN